MTTSSERRVRPNRWELAVAWLYLAVRIVDSVALAIVVVVHWPEFELAFARDPVAVLSLVVPVLSLLAALLLVRMSRWAPLLLVAHLLVAQVYIELRGSGQPVSVGTWASLAINALLLVFCWHLWRHGKLR